MLDNLHAKYVFSVFVTGPDTERIYVFIRICRPLQRPNTLQQRTRHPRSKPCDIMVAPVARTADALLTHARTHWHLLTCGCNQVSCNDVSCNHVSCNHEFACASAAPRAPAHVRTCACKYTYIYLLYLVLYLHCICSRTEYRVYFMY